MSLRLFSSLLLVILFCSGAGARSIQVGGGGDEVVGIGAAKKPTNIIIIVLDDVGQEQLGSYGSNIVASIHTPQMDALAAEGVRFTRFWAHAVCSPFRATALTGQYTQGHGVGLVISTNAQVGAGNYNGLDVTTNNLGRILSKRGYRTEALGKWHLVGQNHPDMRTHPLDLGFTHYAASLGSITNPPFGFGQGTYDSWEKCSDRPTLGCKEETTYATTDTADDVITAIGGTEPFFIWAAFRAAHSPFHKPPANLIIESTAADCVDYDTTPNFCWKQMVEAADTEIGRFLALVDFTDTTVLLMADNGTPGGGGNIVEPPRTTDNNKGTFYKWGVEVPLIIAGASVPLARHGGTATGLTNATDIYKTVLEIAGVSVPANDTSTAVSLLPLIQDGTAEVRDLAYVERFAPNGGEANLNFRFTQAIQCSSSRVECDSDYKLMLELQVGNESEELYDKGADDDELVDLLLPENLPLSAGAQIAYDFLLAQSRIEGGL